MAQLNLNQGKMENVSNGIDYNSKIIDLLVDQEVSNCCKELDDYIRFIRNILISDTSPTNEELNDFALRIPTLMYFAISEQEKLGIKDDISESTRKEAFNTAYASALGTIGDKTAYAEISSLEEQAFVIVNSRAYKTVKIKLEKAQELLDSIKKVITSRIKEMELTRSRL